MRSRIQRAWRCWTQAPESGTLISLPGQPRRPCLALVATIAKQPPWDRDGGDEAKPEDADSAVVSPRADWLGGYFRQRAEMDERPAHGTVTFLRSSQPTGGPPSSTRRRGRPRGSLQHRLDPLPDLAVGPLHHLRRDGQGRRCVPPDVSPRGRPGRCPGADRAGVYLVGGACQRRRRAKAQAEPPPSGSMPEVEHLREVNRLLHRRGRAVRREAVPLKRSTTMAMALTPPIRS